MISPGHQGMAILPWYNSFIQIKLMPVFLVEAKAKEKDEKLFEGKYYIDQTTFDVLKIQVKPSKIPKFVDEMDIEMNFKVLPEGNLVIKSTKTRGSGRVLLIPFRQISEAEYSDYEIMHIVAISHDHYDHLNFNTIKQLPVDIRFYVPLGLEKEFPSRFSDVTGMDWYTRDTAGDLKMGETYSFDVLPDTGSEGK